MNNHCYMIFEEYMKKYAFSKKHHLFVLRIRVAVFTVFMLQK